MMLADHPAVGVALDPSHAPTAAKTWHRSRASRVIWSSTSTCAIAIGKNILVVPGDGTVDFTALAFALREIGYGRAAVIELEYEDATAAAVRPNLG